MKKLKAGVCAVTHSGHVQTDNQDNFVLNGRSTASGELKKGSVYVCNAYEPFYLSVCDGMGAENVGGLASGIACDSLVSHARAVMEAGDDFGTPLANCLREANQKICDEINLRGSRIGSTVAAIYVMKGKVVCVNVGNSRVYRYANGNLEQLSVDHSDGQSASDSRHLGIFPDEAPLSPNVCVLDDVNDGDIILLCSDGLSDLVSDAEISSILDGSENSQDASTRLVKEALRKGGKDNVTVISAFMKAEQTAGFTPKAQNVIGANDADYSEEYESNFGKEADRNAALAALRDDDDDDDDDSSAGAKKILFMAGVILLSAALMVLIAFGVKNMLSGKLRKEQTTAPVQTLTMPAPTSSTTLPITVSQIESETDSETDTSETETESSGRNTTRYTTKRSTQKSTTQKKTTEKKTTEATEPEEVTDPVTDAPTFTPEPSEVTDPQPQNPEQSSNTGADDPGAAS